MNSKLLRIYGKVQGVFYRNTMREKALSLRVKGWVRNRKDGSVESVIQAEKKDDLEKMIEWSFQGPPSSLVEKVEIDDIEEKEVFSSFEIKETL